MREIKIVETEFVLDLKVRTGMEACQEAINFVVFLRFKKKRPSNMFTD